MGPPPMPRKLDMIPSARPMATQANGAAILWVGIRLLFSVYASVPRVITPRQAACTAPTMP